MYAATTKNSHRREGGVKEVVGSCAASAELLTIMKMMGLCIWTAFRGLLGLHDRKQQRRSRTFAGQGHGVCFLQCPLEVRRDRVAATFASNRG